MKKIKIMQSCPKPLNVGFAIVPIGLYCNRELQNATINSVVEFQTSWRKDKRVITNICRFRINSPEFTFMLRSIYGENMTIAKLMEKWEAWAIVEGIGKDGIDREQCVIVEVKPIEEKKLV